MRWGHRQVRWGAQTGEVGAQTGGMGDTHALTVCGHGACCFCHTAHTHSLGRADHSKSLVGKHGR